MVGDDTPTTPIDSPRPLFTTPGYRQRNRRIGWNDAGWQDQRLRNTEPKRRKVAPDLIEPTNLLEICDERNHPDKEYDEHRE